MSQKTQADYSTQLTKKVMTAARKFDSTSLAETAKWSGEGRGVMRASEPEEKTAMAEVRKVRAEKTEAENMRADKTADSSDKG